MGFWVATAALDVDGETVIRVSGSEVLLQPGPTGVEYAQEPNGTIIDTDDGNAVHQQPNLDGRRRQWNWDNYPATQAGYQRVWPLLEGLRSRYRKEAGLSPYVWLKEDVTGGLRRRTTLTGTGSATGFTLTTTGLPAGLAGGTVVIAGQTRAILANTSTTITVGDAFVGSPSGALVVWATTADWFRARVLEVSRAVEPGRTLRYTNSRLVFVIDDAASRDLLG